MSLHWNEMDLGPVDAYALAVKGGYTGTREQWVQEITTASTNAQNSEAYAKGTRGGEAVESDDPAYHNNSKYYSEQSSASATAAAGSATAAAESATAAETAKTYAQTFTGAPRVAATVAGMTDHDLIYVYTGSETGYTSGNWYYWDGSSWTSGGVYNSTALVTDTTLSVSGAAADAEKVGKIKNAVVNCNLFDVLASISGSIDREHRGITYAWNSDKTVCHITGTATGGAAHDSIINSPNALPVGINAGTKIKIEMTGNIDGVKLDVYWYPNTLPDREFVITENTILDIPAECTGVLFRLRTLSGTAMPAGGIDLHIKIYSNYDFSNDKKEIENINEYTEGLDTRHYVVNASDGNIVETPEGSRFYNYRAGITETVSKGIYGCADDYLICCACWDGSTYLGMWNGSGVSTSASGILWKSNCDIDYINTVLETTDIKCRIIAKRKDDEEIGTGKGIIYEINEMQKGIIHNVEDLITHQRKSLYILFIGNSFTEDENDYLPALLKEALPNLRFAIGILYKAGASLEEQWEQYNNETAYARYSEYTSESSAWTITSNSVTMQQALAKYPWDVVTLQQASSDGTDYATYQPYLNNLINAIQSTLAKNVKFVLYLYHAYAQGYTRTGYNGNSDAQYAAVSAAVQEAYAKTAVSEIIPTGTAVQNARTTTLDSLGTFGHLTYDGMHLQEGLPCLIPAYVTLLKVCEWIGYKEIGVLGSKVLPNATWVTAQNIPGKNGSSVGATAANRLIAAKCAIAAIKKPFEKTDCSGM